MSSGGTTPAISMAAATSSVNGYLTSTDWTTFNNKQATLVSGTNIKTVNSTSLLGSGDVSVGVTSVTGTAPVVSSGGATPAISMAAATTSVSGYLTSTDWTTFNNKVSSQWTTTGSTIYYSGGSVGVNTSTVAANCKLAVNGNPPTAGAISSVASSTGGYSLALSDNSSSSLYVSHPAGALSRFSTDGSGQISFATNGTTEAMRIDASQNVGIGTSSPAVKLDVASATPATVVRFSAGNTTLQSYIDNSVGGSYLAAGQVSGTSPTYMAFQTQPSGGSLTERMRITSSGGISFGSSGTAYGTSGQLLQSNGNAAPSWVTISAPQVTVYTSGSGTYTVPSGAKYITVEMIGGGGGGGGGGTPGTGGNGSQGGTTTFGSSSCTGGVGSATGTTGGSATLGSGFVGIAMTGNLGAGFTAWGAVAPVSIYGAGGTGGAGHWGGCGTGNANAAGSSAVANSGAGGGGGGTNNTSAVLIYGGAGSGAGGYIKATVTSLASSYSYSVGAGGTGGTAGTYGYAGGNGGSGIIIVTAYF